MLVWDKSSVDSYHFHHYGSDLHPGVRYRKFFVSDVKTLFLMLKHTNFTTVAAMQGSEYLHLTLVQ